MKQNRSKTKTVVRVIAFLLVAALLYGALSRLLAVNDATEQQYVHSFYLEPKNSLDVMILGIPNRDLVKIPRETTPVILSLNMDAITS